MTQSNAQGSAAKAILPPESAAASAFASRNVTTTVAGIVATISSIALLVLFVNQPAALVGWGRGTTLTAGIGLLLVVVISVLVLWQGVRTSQVDLKQALNRIAALAQVDHEGAQIVAELERRTAEQMQREELEAALAVPLIRVTDQVIVAPLVGTVDEKRLHHIRSSLMQGLEEQRARVVLIDLTGVAEIHDEATDLLAQLLSAIELMGCHILLTGISSSLAQALLAQEALMEVETRRDVMSGLSRATELMGQKDTLIRRS